MADSSIELSFVTELAQILQTYSNDIVIKREDLAKKYETIDTLREFDYYLAAKTGTDTFAGYGNFPQSVMQQAGLTQDEIDLAVINKLNIPLAKRNAVVLIQRQYILANFVEMNDYYRMLIGLPSINDNLQIFISDTIIGVNNSNPIHLMNDDEISILSSLGYIAKFIVDNPKRPYLKYLGAKKVDLIFARISKKFDIIRTGVLDNEKIKNRFEINYLLAKNYIVSVFYIRSLSIDQEYYDAYIGFVILLYALMMTVNESIEIYNAKEYSNDLVIKQLLQSNNLDIFDDIPIIYRRKIADNIESLIVSKSADEVIFKIFQLFGFADITIKKFMIVKDHNKNQDGKYLFSYDFNGLIKLDGPSVLPLDHGMCSAWSPDNNYLAVGITANPFILVYERFNDIFTKLLDPDILPVGSVRGCVWSPDCKHLAVAHDSAPYITIYRKSGTSLIKLPDPINLPTGIGHAISWSDDGNYLSVAHDVSPYMTTYAVSGEVFTKIADPDILPSDIGYSISWSSGSNYLAVGHYGGSFITVYGQSGGILTKIVDVNLVLPNICRGCSWDPTGIYLATVHDDSPQLTVFKRVNSSFSKLPDPDIIPTGNGWSCSWSINSRYLLVGHNTAPRISIYTLNTDILTKLADPIDLPPSDGFGVSISPNGEYVAVAHDMIIGLNLNLALYKTNNYVLRTDEMYDISFSSIDIKSSNIDAEIRKPENKLVYADITSNDIYWGGYESDSAIRLKLLTNDFNYIDTDYISIDSAYSLSAIVTEMSYFFSMGLILKPFLKKLTFIEPLFGHTIDVFYALTMITALVSKKIGFDGNIVVDPANIAEVYKFNFDRSLVEINNIMNKYNYHGNGSDYLLGVPSAEITDPKGLSSLYFYNIAIHDKLQSLKSTTKNLNEYLALRELDTYLLQSKIVSDVYKKINGSVATTYLDYLKDTNIIIGNYIESVDIGDVDSVLFKILSSLEDYFNEDRFQFIFLKTPNVSGDESIKKYMRKVINVFKAFTINIFAITVTYQLDSKTTNNIKILDYHSFTSDQFRINNISLIDTVGVSASKSGATYLKFNDELELIQ
jgi:hypothetical protein